MFCNKPVKTERLKHTGIAFEESGKRFPESQTIKNSVSTGFSPSFLFSGLSALSRLGL